MISKTVLALFCLSMTTVVLFFGCATNSDVTIKSASNTAPTEAQIQKNIEWKLLYQEDFESIRLPRATWQKNTLKEQSRYADNGEYFKNNHPQFEAPESFRTSIPFGTQDWLQFEGYTRDSKSDIKGLFSIEANPDDSPVGSHDKVLRLASPRHTDGALIRPSKALPAEYRVCVNAGYADYGTGYLQPNTNGYDGDETAEPWLDMPSINENGFYWLSILSDVPRPRNNVWIHHHRKVVIDSDNNWYPKKDSGPWSHIWNGKKFIQSGEHPVMMFALDKENKSYVHNYERTGQPFIAWANGQWNAEAEVGEIRSVDAYRERQWYEVCIEKTNAHYRMSISGDFRYGRKQTYVAEIERDRVFDPAGSPDYFMFGDPHANFYEGLVYFDNIRLFIPKTN